MNISRKLKQTAVYWANPTATGAGGRSFDAPVEVSVRWEQKQELFVNADGQETRSMAVVYSAQDMDLDGYLYLGTLNDISSAEEADPMILAGAFIIRGFESVPNVKATQYLRRIWL